MNWFCPVLLTSLVFALNKPAENLYFYTSTQRQQKKKKRTRLITYLYLPLEGAQVTPWVPVTEFKNSCFKALENSIINCRVEKKQRDFQNILHCTSLFLSLKKKHFLASVTGDVRELPVFRSLHCHSGCADSVRPR